MNSRWYLDPGGFDRLKKAYNTEAQRLHAAMVRTVETADRADLHGMKALAITVERGFVEPFEDPLRRAAASIRSQLAAMTPAQRRHLHEHSLFFKTDKVVKAFLAGLGKEVDIHAMLTYLANNTGWSHTEVVLKYINLTRAEWKAQFPRFKIGSRVVDITGELRRWIKRK